MVLEQSGKQYGKSNVNGSTTVWETVRKNIVNGSRKGWETLRKVNCEWF